MASSSSSSKADGEVTTTITATTHLTLPPASESKPLTYSQLNPISKATEFFGPIGTAGITIFTPLLTYILYYGCNEASGCPPYSFFPITQGLKNEWPSVKGRLWDWGAAGVYLAWYVYCVLCWRFLPGEKVQGNLLRDGKRNTYKMNGWNTLLLTLGLSVGIVIQPGGPQLYTYFYDHWVPLVSASLAMATVQALFVYVNSFFSGELLSLGANSGNFFYDFFLGRPLNPTLPGFPSFDIKTFNEVRPGMMLWPVLNISCACEQYVRQGKISDSMWLVLAFELFYTADCEYFEASILNQMDITTDGFGFMLSFGDLVWVPFSYGIQARYLAFHPVHLGLFWSAAIVALKLAGVYIFRVSNNEKGDFRNGKNPKNLTFMTTQRGTKLLTSGWWGRSRHPNYFGDWLMALSWCLPTGFSTPITYFYFAYFVVLLLHRQMRDDEACRHKYGEDWDKYCEKVPYKIIPYVY